MTIDVNADSDVDSIERLVTTFHGLPDAPFTEFDLTITGGKHGILVVSGKPGTCDRDKTVDVHMVGQNGKTLNLDPRASVAGCKPTIVKSSSTKTAVKLWLNNIGPGQITLSGSGIRTTRRTLKAATAATIQSSLTAAARRAFQRGKSVRVTASVRFRPHSGRAVVVRKAVVLRKR